MKYVITALIAITVASGGENAAIQKLFDKLMYTPFNPTIDGEVHGSWGHYVLPVTIEADMLPEYTPELTLESLYEALAGPDCIPVVVEFA